MLGSDRTVSTSSAFLPYSQVQRLQGDKPSTCWGPSPPRADVSRLREPDRTGNDVLFTSLLRSATSARKVVCGHPSSC